MSKTDKNVQVSATIKLNTYKIISDVVEIGITRGWNRSHKHSDNPHESTIINEIHSAVMNELCEILKFDEDE